MGFVPRRGGTPNASGLTTIASSTISGNTGAPGIWAKSPLEIKNSTIAFNVTPGTFGGGVYAIGNLSLQSSIIASNTSLNTDHMDLSAGGGVMVSGADNLIVSTDVSSAPGVITVTGDPQLSPLADNGGSTQTHALPAGSPALDRGNNAAGEPTDQRGAGFPREWPSGKPDIGAFESDRLFADGFESINAGL